MPETPDAALEELYREVILDHYKHPRNRGRLDGPGAEAVELQNPTCGDEIRLSVRVQDDRLADLRFEGRGCSISMASASLMTEACRGLTRDEAVALCAGFKAMLAGAGEPERLGDLAALSGVAQFPVRVKCATLGWNALLRALGGGAAAGDGGAMDA
jgi:nitrogen fixation NifU-like protein